MILDRPPDHGQPQPRPASAHDLLGVEGFEDVLQVRACDALARIGHGENGVIPLPDVVVSLNRPVEVPVARGQRDRPAAGHGLGGIGQKIHDCLVQVDGRALDVQQVRGQSVRIGPGDERSSRFSNSGVLRELLDDGVEIDDLSAWTPRRARVSRSWTIAAALAPPFMIFSTWVRRRLSAGDVVEQQLRIADQDPQNVVEVVGDAARQRAQGLHLFRPLKTLLKLLPLLSAACGR